MDSEGLSAPHDPQARERILLFGGNETGLVNRVSILCGNLKITANHSINAVSSIIIVDSYSNSWLLLVPRLCDNYPGFDFFSKLVVPTT